MKMSRASTLAALLLLAWLVLLLPAWTTEPQREAVTPTAVPDSAGTAEPTQTSPASSDGNGAAASMATSAAARTPIPTPTPNRIERGVENMADTMGVSSDSILGLTAGEWADLAVSALIIVLGFIVAKVLVDTILKRVARRTSTKLDDKILAEVGRELRWLLILLFANYAILGLAFLGDTLRTLLDDLFFLLSLALVTSMALRFIRSVANHYTASLESDDDRNRLEPVIVAAQRFGNLIVLLLAFSFGLAHYGANANAIYFTILAAGLIFSLAARDLIADALGGFIILIDQPFRVGDSVHIRELDTWGDVLSIGTRTTRVRTKDNRELIVPNSQVAKSQIVNYNYPDTKYRQQTDIGVAYGIDIERIRKTATGAVRSVDAVLGDEPVDVFFISFGNASRVVRVRWWIASFHNQWPVMDAVNVALESAFEKAQIDMPYETYALRVHMLDDGGKASAQKSTPAPDNDNGNNS